MSDLANTVLPLIRTRGELYRRGAANAHGGQMHEAVDVLDAAVGTEDPATVFAVTQKALASALTVIARVDDSSGIIGDAVRRLLCLHAATAATAKPSVARLVAWMMKFQFDSDVDYFELDPVAYAPALGDEGIALYRNELGKVAAELGLRPTQFRPGSDAGLLAEDEDRQRRAHDHHVRFTLGWNARRMAVLDRDVDAIIATHSRDRAVAAWLTDTSVALAEIGEFNLAIDWAKQATDFGTGHQSSAAGDHWCALLARHRPDEELAARLEVFRRWPSSSSAARLYACAGDSWPQHCRDVLDRLSSNPRDAVQFTLSTLRDPELAWQLAHSLDLHSADVWNRLATAYEKVDPLAVLPVLTDLVTTELAETGAGHYRVAAKYLKRMRVLAAGTEKRSEVDQLVIELRETHHRRPRLQQEFDRAGLPR
ncbi:DUF6880 family protein [Nocardia noduli]|uniref:DUF6880 family protein n=1 Tax=Nocardia noduli TaxID=2815722 RepID=UPI0027E008BC|nr:DUF6880 family protein [Nocardia noduli]